MISTASAASQVNDLSLETANNCKHSNFWVAYDALDKNNKELIDTGIEMAKEQQKAMVQVGTSVIDKKEVKLANGFRYVMLENDYLKDVQLFQYPLALQKLALFIMETHKVRLLRELLSIFRRNMRKPKRSLSLWL